MYKEETEKRHTKKDDVKEKTQVKMNWREKCKENSK